MKYSKSAVTAVDCRGALLVVDRAGCAISTPTGSNANLYLKTTFLDTEPLRSMNMPPEGVLTFTPCRL